MAGLNANRWQTGFKPDPGKAQYGLLQDLYKIFRMAGNFHLAADDTCLVHDANRGLFRRDVQSSIMLLRFLS